MPDPHDVDDLLRALRAPEPPLEPPPLPRPWRWTFPAAFVGVAVAAAAVSLVWLRPSSAPVGPLIPRGGGGSEPLAVDLKLAVESAGSATHLEPGARVGLGQRVFFRVGAQEPTEVRLWVEGPSGREDIARLHTGPTPVDVTAGAGHVAWWAEKPGTYVFHATSDPEGLCVPASCASVQVLLSP